MSVGSQMFFGSNTSLNITDGWVEMESPVANISGFFLLYSLNGGMFTEMDETDVSHTTASDLLYPIFSKDDTRETELFAINTGTATASGNMTLVRSDGTVKQTYPVSIPAHGIFSDSFPYNTIGGEGYFHLAMGASDKVVGFQRFGNSQALACLNGQDRDWPALQPALRRSLCQRHLGDPVLHRAECHRSRHHSGQRHLHAGQ